MKSICLSLAVAATIGLAIAVPLSSAAASNHARAGARPAAVVAPPRVVVPNRTVALPPRSAGGGLTAKPKPKQPLVRHCSTPDGCYWLEKLCTRDGGGMSTNPDGTGTCTN